MGKKAKVCTSDAEGDEGLGYSGAAEWIYQDLKQFLMVTVLYVGSEGKLKYEVGRYIAFALITEGLKGMQCATDISRLRWEYFYIYRIVYFKAA